MYKTKIDNLISVLRIQSAHDVEHAMDTYILNELQELGAIIEVQETESGKNIYATKGTGPFVCVASHKDTVHDIIDKDKPNDLLNVFELKGQLYAMSDDAQQVGIGGDDKVGIWACLSLLREFDNIKAVFFCSEEIGCRGSREAKLDFFSDCKFILQADRRGYGDFVTDISGPISSQAFQDFVLPIAQQWGYKFCNGGITDVGELSSNNVGISCANLSCGYYHPHTKNEIVVIDEALACLYLMEEIIKESESHGRFLHTMPPKPSYNYGARYGFNDWDWPYYGSYGGGSGKYNYGTGGKKHKKNKHHQSGMSFEERQIDDGYYKDPVTGVWRKRVSFNQELKTNTCTRCNAFGKGVGYLPNSQVSFCKSCDVNWERTIDGYECSQCKSALFKIDGAANYCYCTFCDTIMSYNASTKKGGNIYTDWID